MTRSPVRPAIAVLAVWAAALLGCLAAFGPDLRARGVHAGLPTGASVGGDACMSCHESEAAALEHMRAHAHDGEPSPHASHGPATEPGAPLVADWMLGDGRACSDCHRIRE